MLLRKSCNVDHVLELHSLIYPFVPSFYVGEFREFSGFFHCFYYTTTKFCFTRDRYLTELQILGFKFVWRSSVVLPLFDLRVIMVQYRVAQITGKLFASLEFSFVCPFDNEREVNERHLIGFEFALFPFFSLFHVL